MYCWRIEAVSPPSAQALNASPRPSPISSPRSMNSCSASVKLANSRSSAMVSDAVPVLAMAALQLDDLESAPSWLTTRKRFEKILPAEREVKDPPLQGRGWGGGCRSSAGLADMPPGPSPEGEGSC